MFKLDFRILKDLVLSLFFQFNSCFYLGGGEINFGDSLLLYFCDITLPLPAFVFLNYYGKIKVYT